MPCSRAACLASLTPSVVSWSESASSSTPAAAAWATTAAAGSAPSEWMECDWRSKVGGIAASVPYRMITALTMTVSSSSVSRTNTSPWAVR